jgi:hypothetical protein
VCVYTHVYRCICIDDPYRYRGTYLYRSVPLHLCVDMCIYIDIYRLIDLDTCDAGTCLNGVIL